MNMAVLNPLAGFCGHGLADQMRVALMDRVDAKFVVRPGALEQCLQGLRGAYTILDMDGCRRFVYDTLYFDSPDRRLFLDHHNGKLNRLKVRLRHYRHSKIMFLEVKKKTNRQRTVKTRVPVTFESFVDGSATRFLKEQSGLPVAGMQPALFVSYQRITLISTQNPERITIDTQLAFHSPDRTLSVDLPGVAIVEVKHDRHSGCSPMLQSLARHGCRPVAFSKYCVGTSLLYGSQLKTNRFKPLLRSLYGIGS
ncbi:polyphosphate polymerase domain-containing protein [Marinobacter xiaoshiensis]|uniref:Polyphosphate polymerase domain-containing protein n=1 Tax=Marinobacter xiaoshiensis TaxID=3073652 RepID=A0ABU2HJD5_9GAMM|nr:polyphosphate polymerase domain-containing protein [Marinobacter sp. F60267]MDS1311170.1 polyphosphate polymerase domain-containing protein [Marinobacter sp. F60267]